MLSWPLEQFPRGGWERAELHVRNHKWGSQLPGKAGMKHLALVFGSYCIPAGLLAEELDVKVWLGFLEEVRP